MKSWHLAALCAAALGLPHNAVAADVDWNEARKFWSFQPVSKPASPAVKNGSWPTTEIDRFILARLETAGLNPAVVADKRTLIRRATFDLTGLPPTPEEIDAFLADKSPKAFESVIDRLLASPHYGERWARHWLDVARYAEDQAHTFGVKPNTEAYRYRDWVIDAFNADMPYDRFVKLQIAADLMEHQPDRIGDKAALGFFGLGAQYYKGNDRAAADEIDDRIDTMTKAFLGLTVSCARCHDHKFDPIPTLDYYSLAGVFQSTKLANVPLATKEVTDRLESMQKQLDASDKQMKEFVRQEKLQWAKPRMDEVVPYMLAVWQVRAHRQSNPKYSTAEQATLDKLDVAVLDRWFKALQPDSKTAQGIPTLDAFRKLPLPAKGKAVEVTPEVRKAAEAFLTLIRAGMAANDALAPIVKKGANGSADRLRQDMVGFLFADNGVYPITDTGMMARLNAEKKSRLETMKSELDRLKKDLPPTPATAHGIGEGTPADMKVLVRGNPADQGELAPRRFLHVLTGGHPERFTKGSGRLELADAIASKDNPLTARVLVNRLWQWHFGRGIVATPSNFGQLGQRATHPELLDYLATRFVASGWSIKAIHREIMLSKVYQLSSVDDAKPQAANRDPQVVDPDNNLLWRASRSRLDVENWRDALLAVSGQLDPSFGGPTTDLGSVSNRRRTVYAKVSRHELNGLLRLFDFPDANISSERRVDTTVPQQQLFVLNSPFFIGQAKALAARVQKESPDDTERVRRAYLLTYGRPASDAEVVLALRFLGGKDDPTEAKSNQLTRWERYAQVLLAGNEFLYVD